MRKPLIFLLIGLVATGSLMTAAPRTADAYVSINVSYFYDALAPYGDWVDYGSYGYCWVPDVPADWRPYSDGYWVYADYGWTWVDNEPWGWAPFHYGRWVFDEDYGWVWVPGTTWAPAWVAWRACDDYVGWAPLPPVYGWQSSISFTYVNYAADRIPVNEWCFVRSASLCDRDLRYRISSVSRNPDLFEISRNATRFAWRGDQIVNRGVDVNQYQRSTGVRVPRFQVASMASPIHGRAQRIRGNEIAFFRPSVHRGGSGEVPRDLQASRERGGHGDRFTAGGHGDAGSLRNDNREMRTRGDRWAGSPRANERLSRDSFRRGGASESSSNDRRFSRSTDVMDRDPGQGSWRNPMRSTQESRGRDATDRTWRGAMRSPDEFRSRSDRQRRNEVRSPGEDRGRMSVERPWRSEMRSPGEERGRMSVERPWRNEVRSDGGPRMRPDRGGMEVRSAGPSWRTDRGPRAEAGPAWRGPARRAPDPVATRDPGQRPSNDAGNRQEGSPGRGHGHGHGHGRSD